MTWTSPIPQLGLGTYGRTGDDGMAAILAALELGYRHIDTAQSYDTEAQRRRGDAPLRPAARRVLRHHQGRRHQPLAATRFAPSVARSLETLGVDQVDLLLIHWPSHAGRGAARGLPDRPRRGAGRGQARLIGVSNFTIDHLERAERILGEGALATNQVEIHPYLQAPKLRDYARGRGLPLTAYEPLVRGQVARRARCCKRDRRPARRRTPRRWRSPS